MVTWIFNNPLVAAGLAFAGASALLVLGFLVRRPTLAMRGTKFLLLLAIGVFPIMTAATGNYAGFEATKARSFCGSCHVMTPYSDDSDDPRSTTLAARHARNKLFGEENCYGCHADYGMFGTVITKLGGLRHVYLYTTEYHAMSLAEAREKIHILKPFQNATCMHCHSTEGPTWNAVREHASLLPLLREGAISCASGGCHGPAHPFSKKPMVTP